MMGESNRLHNTEEQLCLGILLEISVDAAAKLSKVRFQMNITVSKHRMM